MYLNHEFALDVEVHHHGLVDLVGKLEPDPGFVVSEPEDGLVGILVSESGHS